jgi:phosphopantetheine--protein transferase-like protein
VHIEVQGLLTHIGRAKREAEAGAGERSRVVGVGADILSIDRIRLCLESPSFVSRTFTQAEQNGATRHSEPAAYFARVFAAKEAIFKCFGVRAEQLHNWLDIEVLAREAAGPKVRLHGYMATMAGSRGTEEILVSWSSDTDYAVAFAAIVRE